MLTRLLFFTAVLLVVFTLGVSSCKKSGGDGPGSSFKWTYNNITYNGDYVFAHSVEDLGPNIGAYTPSFRGHGLSIKIIPLSVGSYTVGSSVSDKQMQFSDPQGFSYQCAGTFTISSVSQNKMSGNFAITASGASSFSVTGVFSNVPITP